MRSSGWIRAGCLFLIMIIIILPSGLATELQVSYLNITQGNAILLQSGDNSMLIDSGNSGSGEDVLSFLKKKGVNSLDVIVASEQSDDQIGAMSEVLHTIPVNRYVDNGAPGNTPAYKQVMSNISKKQINYSKVSMGNIIPFVEGIEVKVLEPAHLSGDTGLDSLVLKVTDRKIKFLFLNDRSDVNGDIYAQILKVSGDGSSRGSSGLLDRIRPEVAVIEKGTMDADISRDFLNNLQSMGAEIYRTDTDGNITITTDGSVYSVRKDTP